MNKIEKSDIIESSEQIMDEYIKDLSSLVSIYSKNRDEEACAGAPFGKECRQALDAAATIARKLGFDVSVDPEGYYAYADIGSGKEMMGVLGHMDVVPADDLDNWDTNPCELVVKDKKMFGRGTSDDKGPMLASMYAMKILLDKGAVLNHRVRFILCSDEECLWRCIDKYIEKEECPSFGFTPDADFPMVYAEAGLLELTISSTEEKAPRLLGEGAFNAVCASASTDPCTGFAEVLDKLGIRYKMDDENLTVIGKTAHAMAADEGINAISLMAKAFASCGVKSSMIDFINESANVPHGTNIFGEVSDEHTGKLMFNIGIADIKDGTQSLGIDIRYPSTTNKEEVTDKITKAAAKYGLKVEEYSYLRPVFVPMDSNLAKVFMGAYQDVTGDMESKAVATSGATFARSMENIIAFGAVMPDTKKTEHQPNEFAYIKDIKDAIVIYALAFQELVCDSE